MRVANYFSGRLCMHTDIPYAYLHICRERECVCVCERESEHTDTTPTSGSLAEMNPDTCRQDDTKQVKVCQCNVWR